MATVNSCVHMSLVKNNAATGRYTSTNLHLQQDPASLNLNATNTGLLRIVKLLVETIIIHTGSASNIVDNSTSAKLLPHKETVPSNVGEYELCTVHVN